MDKHQIQQKKNINELQTRFWGRASPKTGFFLGKLILSAISWSLAFANLGFFQVLQHFWMNKRLYVLKYADKISFFLFEIIILNIHFYME
jgi:hypothetical protein